LGLVSETTGNHWQKIRSVGKLSQNPQEAIIAANMCLLTNVT